MSRRHHHHQDEHTSSRHHSSHRYPEHRGSSSSEHHFSTEQLPAHKSRNIRNYLHLSCTELKAILVRSQNDEAPPEISSYTRAMDEVKAHLARILRPDCEQERMNEKAQVAILTANQLFELEELLRRQNNERWNLQQSFRGTGGDPGRSEVRPAPSQDGWTILPPGPGRTQYVSRLVGVEQMPSGFSPY